MCKRLFSLAGYSIHNLLNGRLAFHGNFSRRHVYGFRHQFGYILHGLFNGSVPLNCNVIRKTFRHLSKPFGYVGQSVQLIDNIFELRIITQPG